MIVPEIHRAEAGHEIEIRTAIGVPYLHSLAAHECLDQAALADHTKQHRANVSRDARGGAIGQGPHVWDFRLARLVRAVPAVGPVAVGGHGMIPLWRRPPPHGLAAADEDARFDWGAGGDEA